MFSGSDQVTISSDSGEIEFSTLIIGAPPKAATRGMNGQAGRIGAEPDRAWGAFPIPNRGRALYAGQRHGAWLTAARGPTVVLETDVMVSTRLEVYTGGTISVGGDGAWRTLTVDNTNGVGVEDLLIAGGTLEVGSAGRIQLADGAHLKVQDNGTFFALGSDPPDCQNCTQTDCDPGPPGPLCPALCCGAWEELNYAKVTRREGETGDYTFEVAAGTLSVANTIFEYMDTEGIHIGALGIIGNVDGYGSLERSVFRNGTSGSFPLLKVENDQDVTAGYVTFGDYPESAGFNVSKTSATGSLFFETYGGSLAEDTNVAQAYEDDTYGGIDWGSPTAVTLLSFEACPGEGAVTVLWATGSEEATFGFNLYRSTTPEGPYSRINGPPIPARGIGGGGAQYEYMDEGLDGGVAYFYELEELEFSGATNRYGPVWAVPE